MLSLLTENIRSGRSVWLASVCCYSNIATRLYHCWFNEPTYIMTFLLLMTARSASHLTCVTCADRVENCTVWRLAQHKIKLKWNWNIMFYFTWTHMTVLYFSFISHVRVALFFNVLKPWNNSEKSCMILSVYARLFVYYLFLFVTRNGE